MKPKLLKNLIHKELSLFDLSGGPLVDPIYKDACILSDLELAQYKKPSSSDLLSKTITDKCFNFVAA